MAYTAENEVLHWLLNDTDRTSYDKFVELVKGVNPFDVAQAALFEIIRDFRLKDKMPDFTVVEAVVRESDSGAAFAARIAIEDLRGYKGNRDLYLTSVKIVREKYLERATISAAKTVVEIITSGVRIGRNEFKGLEDSWRYWSDRRQQISDVQNSSVSAGDMFSEMQDVMAHYEAIKADPSKLGRISTGVRAIDEATNGMAGGEMWIVGAFAGEGKSTLLRNMAYWITTREAKNVVYATTEMTRKQIRNMILSRHTYHKKWSQGEWAHEPIPYRVIRDGKVGVFFKNKYERDLGSAAESRGAHAEEFLKRVADDLSEGRKSGEYGMFDILQVPGNMTVPDFGDYLNLRNKENRVDVAILDYAMQFMTNAKSTDRHEIHAAKLRACKQLALDFGTREQLAVVTAHQIGREDREEAEKKLTSKRTRGIIKKAPEDVQPYSTRALAGTAEAEKSADVILWMLLLDRYKEENLVRVGMLKNREGILAKPFFMRSDFACSFLGNMGI
jgi:replicative DNA helicase